MFSATAELYDGFYAFKDWEAEVALLRRHIVEAGGPAQGTLLDVACGTGRHLELLRSSYAVEGLDLDEGLLAVARERLPGVPLHHADMRSFDLGRRFDVVTCLFSSIGYVDGVDELQRSIQAMERHLAPGGVLLVEPWFAPDRVKPPRPHLLTAEGAEWKAARMSYSTVAERHLVLHFEYLIGTATETRRASEQHHTTLFTAAEMRDAFVGAGLRVRYDEAGLSGRGLYIAVHAE